MPTGLAIALRVAAVSLLLVWAANQVDRETLVTTLARGRPVWIALAASIVILSQLTAGWRWHRLLCAAGSHWTFGRTFAVYAAGLFLGLFIPTGVGGDVYRVARMRASGTGFVRGSATILLERAIGLLALLILGTGLIARSSGLRPWALPVGAGAVGGVVGLFALWHPQGLVFLGRLLGRRFRELFPSDTMERLRGALPGTLGLSLLNHTWILLANLALARAFALDVPLGAVAAAVPLVLLAAQIPIAPGGLGVREAGYVYFLGKVGVPQAEALALALGWLALLLGVGLLGALGLLADRGQKQSNSSEARS